MAVKVIKMDTSIGINSSYVCEIAHVLDIEPVKWTIKFMDLHFPRPRNSLHTAASSCNEPSTCSPSRRRSIGSQSSNVIPAAAATAARHPAHELSDVKQNGCPSLATFYSVCARPDKMRVCKMAHPAPKPPPVPLTTKSPAN